MAAAYFNRLANPARAHALSGGTEPAARVHPEVCDAMREAGVDLGEARPRLLTPDLAPRIDWLITMGCGESCPVVPGARREDWPIDDPAGQPVARVREIRDEIRERVETFVAREELG